MRVTAMDLGTSNTCVTSCSDGPVTVIRPEGWHNTALGGALPTLILYNNGQPFLIGAAAEYEFGEAGEQERKSYSLRGQFKPDIAVREDARQWLCDFPRPLRQRVTPSGHTVVGLPTQAAHPGQPFLRNRPSATGLGGVH